MKKTIVLIILILSVFSTHSQENKILKVTYKKLFQQKEVVETKAQSEASIRAQEFLDAISESIQKVEYNLFIGTKFAKFEYNEILQDKNFKNIAIIFGGGETHYYDFKKDKVYKLNIDKSKLIEYSADSLTWKLTEETKEINGFTCYRAFGKTKIYTRKQQKEVEYDVWYCPKFNTKCGPSQFFGLPGLIFEASQKDSGLKFVLKKIEYINNKGISTPKLPIISEEQNHKDLVEKMEQIEE